MWALIRTLSYSFEVTLNKAVLKTIKPIDYLSKKYLLGLIPLLIYFFMSDYFIAKEGIFLLAVILIILTTQQLISLSSLSKIDATTHTIIGQTRLFWLIILGLIFGSVITYLKIIGVILCFIGGILVTIDELNSSKDKKNSLQGVLLAIIMPFLSMFYSYLLEYSLENNYFSTSIYITLSIILIVIFYNVLNIIKKQPATENKKPISFKTLLLIESAGLLSILVNTGKTLAIDSIGVFSTEVIASLAPIIIFIIALVLKTEKMTLKKLLGVLIAVAGIIISIL
ncbi:MAG: EamA family transporter [Spirochaetales bacterium]